MTYMQQAPPFAAHVARHTCALSLPDKEGTVAPHTNYGPLFYSVVNGEGSLHLEPPPSSELPDEGVGLCAVE